jgi:hypothetical protein
MAGPAHVGACLIIFVIIICLLFVCLFAVQVDRTLCFDIILLSVRTLFKIVVTWRVSSTVAIYAPMIYMALCVMLLMRPQMALAYRL